MRTTRGTDDHQGQDGGETVAPAAGKRSRTEAVQRRLADNGPTPIILPATPAAAAPDAFDFSDLAVQRRAEGGAPSDPDTVGRIAESGLGSGSELPHRAALESGFGVDLSGVRAHTDGTAAGASRAIGAEAYTMGQDIAFATPSPSQELVAHEVAHVIQQSAGAGPASGVGTAGDRFEVEADAAAATVAGGGQSDLANSYAPSNAAGALQRKAVQRYESAEHAMIGDGMTYPVVISGITLPNKAVVTRGELVALGDFYGSYEALAQAPREETEAIVGLIRWEGIWTLAGRQKTGGTITTDPAKPDPKSLETAAHPDDKHFAGGHASHGEKGLVTWEGAEWEAKVGDAKLRDKAMEIHAQFTPSWQFFSINVPMTTFSHSALTIHHMKATLGRRRFRNTNNTLGQQASGDFLDTTNKGVSDPGNLGGDFFDLASNNLSHFAISNWATWENYHQNVCKLVDDARNGTPEEKKKAEDRAVIEDAWGCHFLTDMYASGHVVNKQQLMTEATSMMAGMAKDHGLAKGTETGEKKHAVLRDMLTESLQIAFRDDAVYKGWQDGCKNAFDQGLVRYDELELMLTIARGTQWSTGLPTVVGNLVDTIMGMPWRDMQKNNTPGGDKPGGAMPDNRESFGPGNKDKGQGDYHLGVGNLAALTVHNALNKIGFEAKNKFTQWRMQGDAHLTAATQAQAHGAVEESARQAKEGKSEPDKVKEFTPSEVRMDPAWLDLYVDGRKADGMEYNTAALADVKTKAKALADFKPLNNAAGTDVSPDLSALCTSIMKAEFTAPEGQYEALVKKADAAGEAGTGDDSGSMNNTGVNIAFLKVFLVENLPRMVPLAYAAASAADLSSAALEVYKPRKNDGTVLPTGASDFTWSGDQVSFNVNVSDCKPGKYKLGIQVHDQDGGIDYKPSGQLIEEPLGRDDDEVYGAGGEDPTAKFLAEIEVPENAAAAENGRTYVKATWSLAGKGDANHKEHYIRVFADEGCQMVIGRSSSKGSGEKSNPSTLDKAPKATGDDRIVQTLFNATGVEGNAFAWDGNSVRFRLESNAPPMTGFDRRVRAWVKQFNRDSGYDYDEHGRQIPTEKFEIVDTDDLIGGPSEVSGQIIQLDGKQLSQQVVFDAKDDDGDTYVIVYADAECTQPISRSNVQGTNKGKVKEAQPVGKASSVSSFAWSGNKLSFGVAPPDALKVFVKLFDKDSGYDYDTSGRLMEGSRDEDEQYGGIHEVTVSKGKASIVATGDAAHEDTYAIVYSDPGCTTPLGRSDARG